MGGSLPPTPGDVSQPKENQMYAQPGYKSDGTAFLKVLDGDTRGHAAVAEYELRYLPDTHEVVLLKKNGDEWEAAYSEILST
jgi:hypothetical protein